MAANFCGSPEPARICAPKGFTLVEMAIALVISSIVLIGIAVILSSSHGYIYKSRKKMRLQQDLSLLQQTVATCVRNSIAGKQEIYKSFKDFLDGNSTVQAGSCLKVVYPSGKSSVLYKENSDIKTLSTDSGKQTLIYSIAKKLVFVNKSGSIETRVKLTQGQWAVSDTLVDAFRNFN